jgi:hypothetical protein
MRTTRLSILLATAFGFLWIFPAQADSSIPCEKTGPCQFVLSDPTKYADFVVPSGVNEITVEIIGASGGVSDNGQLPSPVGYLIGAIKVEAGGIVRLAPGLAGKNASDGGLGGTNPTGGFAGGGGGYTKSGVASGGGGGAASVVFYKDLVFIAGGGGGGNGTEAGGGGGGGESGGAGGIVSGQTTQSAASGVTRALTLSGSTSTVAPGTNGVITVSYSRTAVLDDGQQINPADPLSTPNAVASFAVVAMSIVSSIGALWSAPRSDDEEIGSISNVDLPSNQAIKAARIGWGDKLRIWRSSFLTGQDLIIAHRIYRWASVSRLVTRLNIDGAYLRAIAGALTTYLKILSIGIGLYGGFSADSTIQISFWILLALTCIGVLDALSGALGYFALILSLAIQETNIDLPLIQYFAGMALLGFAPILAGSAFRGFRRDLSMGFEHFWNRIGDLVLTTFFIVWIYQNLLTGLSVLARSEIEIQSEERLMSIAIAGAFLLRLLLEEIAARHYPLRLASDHTLDLPEQKIFFQTLAMIFRTTVFFLVSASFIGICWQLWVGTLIYLIPQLLGIIDFQFKAPKLLLASLPNGLASLVTSLVVGFATAAGLNYLIGNNADFARTSFALSAIPITAISIVRNFGQHENFDPDKPNFFEQGKIRHSIYGMTLFVITLKLTDFI